MPTLSELRRNLDQQRKKLQASIQDAHTLLEQGKKESVNSNDFLLPTFRQTQQLFRSCLVLCLSSMLTGRVQGGTIGNQINNSPSEFFVLGRW